MTNPFYSSPEPMRMCNKCNTLKTLDLLVPCRNSIMGVRPLCKVCKNAQQLADRIARGKKQVEKVVEDRKAREADPAIAAPRTVTAGYTRLLEPAPYYRNEGNKHIPSKGV